MLHEEDIEGSAIPKLYAKYTTIEGMKKFATAYGITNVDLVNKTTVDQGLLD